MAKRKLTLRQERRIKENRQGKLDLGERADAAVVVAHMGFHLIVEQGDKLYVADWRKRVGDIAINDKVVLKAIDGEHAIVEAVFPREKTLYKWQGRKLKPVASNIDQLLIMLAIEPSFTSEFIDRYLIAAKEAGIPIAIFCNKLDIADAEQKQAAAAKLAIYERLGYPVFYGSVKDSSALTSIETWLGDKQTLVCGQSGVGKSSLIRHLIPNVDIWIQSISEVTGLGRHTTTNSRRYPLAGGGAVIDTPGVRGFAITHLDKAHVIAGFPDIAAFANDCKFSDCSHTHEPGCAILAAVKHGKIAQSRYQSMMHLIAELEED